MPSVVRKKKDLTTENTEIHGEKKEDRVRFDANKVFFSQFILDLAGKTITKNGNKHCFPHISLCYSVPSVVRKKKRNLTTENTERHREKDKTQTGMAGLH